MCGKTFYLFLPRFSSIKLCRRFLFGFFQQRALSDQKKKKIFSSYRFFRMFLGFFFAILFMYIVLNSVETILSFFFILMHIIIISFICNLTWKTVTKSVIFSCRFILFLVNYSCCLSWYLNVFKFLISFYYSLMVFNLQQLQSPNI